MAEPAPWETYLQQMLERMAEQSVLTRTALEAVAQRNELDSGRLRQPREAKGPDVETFDGTKSLTLRSWCNQLAIKFAAEPQRFPDERSKVLYAGQRLRSNPADWFAAAIGPAGAFADNYNGIPSYEEFTDEMQTMYGDANQRKEARRTMERMVQGTGRVATYTADFRIQQQIAGDSDDKVVDWYYRGLSRDIKDILSQARDVWETLPQLIRQATNIDERRLEREHEAQMERNGRTLSYAGVGRLAPPRPQAPRANPGSATPVAGATLSPTDSAGDSQMSDVAAARAEQRRKGECFKCGQKGHLARECTLSGN